MNHHNTSERTVRRLLEAITSSELAKELGLDVAIVERVAGQPLPR
jgi:hypothetical protein